MQTAKDRYIARELALLRASRPHPPMVSHIDEVNDAAVEEGIRREIEGHSSQPSALSAAEPSDPSAAEPSALSAALSAAEPSDPSAAEPPDPSAAEPSDPSRR
ncbi:hypothetical protein DPEC_G00282520 [Dallia pectoralis]|uniref:Uncharacterized protein n=1 Tax=Dallia pectoralis TaxID=75939 RepID=A0ACC2FNF6_DALPE|nr:hypothetical protein DPEC_G00282520 [Dallia pectoralis]